MELTEALREVQAHSDLSPRQWDDLVQVVLWRSSGPVPGSSHPICGAQNEALTWEYEGSSAWVNQAEFAKILGLPAINLRMWHRRGKLPPPDERVSGHPVWSRATVKHFCADLVTLRAGVET